MLNLKNISISDSYKHKGICLHMWERQIHEDQHTEAQVTQTVTNVM